MASSCRRFAVLVAMLLCVAAVPSAWAQINGTLGIFFDPYAKECAGPVSIGSARALYVLFLPEGDTRGGITGVEFRIDASAASGYSFRGEAVAMPSAIRVGPLEVGGPGLSVVSDQCHSRAPIPILSFQVQNLGGGTDGGLRIAAKDPPWNPNFPCPLVTLCDNPAFTKVCIAPGLAVLNPSGAIHCGSSAESSEWGRVKELYR